MENQQNQQQIFRENRRIVGHSVLAGTMPPVGAVGLALGGLINPLIGLAILSGSVVAVLAIVNDISKTIKSSRASEARKRQQGNLFITGCAVGMLGGAVLSLSALVAVAAQSPAPPQQTQQSAAPAQKPALPANIQVAPQVPTAP